MQISEAKAATAYYLGLFSSNMDPDRSFASARLPLEMSGRNLAALSTENSKVYVVNESGKFLVYKFDSQSGGDCGAATETNIASQLSPEESTFAF